MLTHRAVALLAGLLIALLSQPAHALSDMILLDGDQSCITDNTSFAVHGANPLPCDVTIPADALVGVAFFCTFSGGDCLTEPCTISNSGTALTWFEATTPQLAIISSDDVTLYSWIAESGSGGSTTISVFCDDAVIYSARLFPFYFTGYDTMDTIGGVAANKDESGGGASGSFALTLDATPAAESVIVAVVALMSSSTAISQGSGWTEVVDDWGIESFVQFQAQKITGVTSTNVPWVDATTLSGGPLAALAIEFKAAAAVTQGGGPFTGTFKGPTGGPFR